MYKTVYFFYFLVLFYLCFGSYSYFVVILHNFLNLKRNEKDTYITPLSCFAVPMQTGEDILH